MSNNAPSNPDRVLSTLNRDGSRLRMRPKLSKGRFLNRRRAVGYGLIIAFVLLPYLEFRGKPLILLDLPGREFTFFGHTFLPTDTMLLMLLGLGITLTVFLLTALFGRVWCGWACPQTVYMEFLYRPIERLFEGTPSQQRKIDREGVNLRRIAKNIAFFFVSLFVANVFLAYFVGVDRLLVWMQSSPAEHPVGFMVVASVTVLMFVDFAWFREQTCIVACPYGRLQSVLLDTNSLIVGYDEERGEPRGKMSKKAKTAGAERGDCIDCNACFATCPTGIDIRNGLQMECIGCAQCIDACDAIMERVGKPKGLIRYSTQEGLAGKPQKLLRPRVVIYPALIVAVAVGFALTFSGKGAADAEILRAGTPFTKLDDGRISNQIQVSVVNRTRQARTYKVELEGAPDATFIAPEPTFTVKSQKSRVTTVIVLSNRDKYRDGKRAVRFRISDDAGFEKILHYELLGPLGGGK